MKQRKTRVRGEELRNRNEGTICLVIVSRLIQHNEGSSYRYMIRISKLCVQHLIHCLFVKSDLGRRRSRFLSI